MSVNERRLLLVDASGFIFRAYHAIAHLSTSKGFSTNAVLGFTRMVLKLLREEKPSHLALAFDKDSRRGRLEIDPTYKANREAPPDDLREQFVKVREVAEVLGLTSLEVPGWEADDIIATLTRRAVSEGWQVRIITGDKDFIQLLGPGVELFDPMKEVLTRAEDVPGRLGIQATQMRDYLALIGDAIDNVAKVPGVGPKTAVELLAEFGDVETLLTRLEEVKKPKIREALRTHTESLQRAKKLVSFKEDLDLPMPFDGLVLAPIQMERARELFTELEFYRLLQELPAIGHAPPPPVSLEPEAPARVLLDPEALAAFCDEVRAAGTLSLAGAVEGKTLVGLGLAWSDAGAAYVPLHHRSLISGAGLNFGQVKAALGPLFADPAVVKVGHGLKALMERLVVEDLPLAGPYEDVELLSYLLNPSRREHALADLSRERLRRELPMLVAGRKAPALEDRTVDEVATCAVPAARAALALQPLLWPELEGAGMATLARTLELPLLPVLARMELRGIRVDTELLARLSEKVDAECLSREQEIHRLAGRPFVIGSNQQLAQVLFVELGPAGPQEGQDRSQRGSGGPGEALRAAPAAARDPRVPLGGEAQEHLPGHAAAAGGPREPHPHHLPPGGGGDRAALLVGPEPPEHPHPHRAGPGDPPGLRRRPRTPAHLRGLQPGGAADPGPRRGRSRASWRPSARTRTCTPAPPRRSSPSPSRR